MTDQGKSSESKAEAKPVSLTVRNEEVEATIKKYGKPVRTKEHGLDHTVLYWK